MDSNSNSVNVSKFKKFLDGESVVYKLEVSDTSLYLLLCNVNQSFGKEIISGLLEKSGEKLNFQKISSNDEEKNLDSNVIYSFQDLNQRFSNGLNLPTEVNQKIIRDISNDQWKDKYLHLVYYEGEFLIKSYEDQDSNGNDSAQIILGVFLTEKEKIFSLLETGDDLILNDFKEEVRGKVSDLFYYEEEEVGEQDQDQEYYKKVKKNDEGKIKYKNF
jgi:hypothetical protein